MIIILLVKVIKIFIIIICNHKCSKNTYRWKKGKIMEILLDARCMGNTKQRAPILTFEMNGEISLV